MKLTLDNYKKIVNKNDIGLIESFLIDVQDINNLLKDQNQQYKEIYIDFETEHTEYSPERTEPCPDYYGMYTLRFEKNPYETIGDYMTTNELDNAIFVLTNFIEFSL